MPENKNTTKQNWVDPDDAPELTREWFQSAHLYDGTTLVRRGRPRKEKENKKVSLHLMVDFDIADTFRKTGRGWQTRLNALLRNAIEQGLV
jgi:uncharacterized protein (DUF4415 family)